MPALVAGMVAGMVAGADSIDDMDLLRHGGMRRLFTGIRAPSTLGTFLRAFAFGHVRQLDAIAARSLARLAGSTPLLPGAATVTYVDVDSLFMSAHQSVEGGATGTLVRINLPTGSVTPVLRKRGFGLEGVAVAPDGSVFVVANQFCHQEHQLIRVPRKGSTTTVFSRPDILLERVTVTRSGAPLVTGRTWPAPDPDAGQFGGQLLRLSPDGGGGPWPATPVSVGGLLRSPDGLLVVPSAPG